MSFPNIINIYIVIVLFEYLITRLYLKHKKMPLRSVIVNLIADKVRLLVGLFVINAVIPPTHQLVSQYGLQLYTFQAYDSIAYFVLLILACFLIYEFYWYAIHWLNHKSDFLWSIHEYHHSAEYYNHSLMGRVPILLFFEGYLGVLILSVLGFPQEVMSVVLSFTTIYIFYTHSDYVPETPTLSKVMISQQDHSKHHEAEFSKQNSNYGNCLSIYDHLFGTYNRSPKSYKYGVNAEYDTDTIFESQFKPVLRYLSSVFQKRANKQLRN